MSLRLKYREQNPEAFNTMIQLEKFNSKASLDKVLYELIKIRSSQINGCAYCLDMHTRDIKKLGETDQRINLISVWREANDIFTEKEKVILELTEAVTLISNGGVSDDLYERTRQFFSEKEYVDIIMAINTIN